jgi:hypothetical protein
VELLYCKNNIPHLFPMDHNRIWKIMNWNIRGINAEKWLAIASKVKNVAVILSAFRKPREKILTSNL